jgi:hypothetical protein
MGLIEPQKGAAGYEIKRRELEEGMTNGRETAAKWQR